MATYIDEQQAHKDFRNYLDTTHAPYMMFGRIFLPSEILADVNAMDYETQFGKYLEKFDLTLDEFEADETELPQHDRDSEGYTLYCMRGY